MILLIEIPKEEKAELEALQKEYPDSIELVQTKRLIGAEDVLQAIVELTAAFGPMLITYLMARKKEKKPTVIKIDGVEIEYTSKEELEAILEKHLEEEDKANEKS